MLSFLSRHRLIVIVFGIFCVLILAVGISYFVPLRGEICSKNEYTNAKECVSYYIASVLFWQIIKAANDYGAAITALATIAIAGFTATLWWATTEHGKITGQVLDITREEFNATHRPKLVIREIDLFWALDRTEISFVIINEGDSTAHEIKHQFSIIQQIMGFHGYINEITGINPIQSALEPGKAISYKGRCHINIPDFLNSINYGIPTIEQPRPIQSLFFSGTVNYTGGTGIARRSAYYRRWNIETHSFVPGNDPEKEYPG